MVNIHDVWVGTTLQKSMMKHQGVLMFQKMTIFWEEMMVVASEMRNKYEKTVKSITETRQRCGL